MTASPVSCRVLPPAAWAEENGYDAWTHANPGVSPADLYLDEGLLPNWRIEAVRYAAQGERHTVVADARDAALGSLGFVMPGGRIDEAFYAFSRRGDLMVEDPYWLPWIQNAGPFRGLEDGGAALRVDFTDAAAGAFAAPVFFVGSRGNWSHWLLDFASRLYFWENHPARDELTPLFGPLTALHRRTLAVFGMDPAACAQLAVEPGRLRVVSGERIVVPETPPKELAFAYVREKFSRWRAENQTPERIYLTRRNFAPRHRVANDAAVAESLEARGFSTIAIETLRFSEQLDVLTRARLVVMPVGGEIGNLAVCQPGTVVVLLVSQEYAARTPVELLRREIVRFVFGSGLPTVVVTGRTRDPADVSLDALSDYDLGELAAAVDRAEDLLAQGA